MAEITTVPFGPQHPVLPEPVHLDLELKDEKVVRAIPSIGYVHRGLEKLVEKRDFKQFTFVAERVCGICSFGHGWGYVKAVEGLMGIEVPRRASYLRTLWHELSRVHSHLLWLGLAADAMGFESLFMTAWRLRETVLDLFEETTGGRVIFSVCKVGGVRRDLTGAMMKEIEDKLKGMAGMVGSETAFGVCYTKLCREQRLPLEMLSFLMSAGPAAVLGLADRKGMLEPGYDADIVLVDLDHMYEVHADELHSKSKNCPYDGALLYGKVVTTIKGGKVTFQIEE